MLPSNFKILIAEDSEPDRMLLDRIVRAEGYRTVLAADGQQAIDAFQRELPAIVLMDVMMPLVDGLQAARRIKALAGENFVPVLFLTSLNDEKFLASSLESGGDDFLAKPYKPIVIAAKITVYKRMVLMHRTLQQQRDKIAKANEHFRREQELAKKVFDNIAHMGCLDQLNIRYLLSPMSIFHGDVLLASRKPSGGLVVFLGDFTGHGLPAAIGAMPVSEIFYSMIAKGFGSESVLAEINQKLKAILPVGFFCCASLIDISYKKQRVKLWNGGMPDIVLKRQSGELVRHPADYLPLGILPSDQFLPGMRAYEMSLGDKVYVWSDGITELRNPAGQMLGQEKLVSLLEQGDKRNAFDDLLGAAQDFSENLAREDDLTMAELTMLPPESVPSKDPLRFSGVSTGAQDWAFSYELRRQSIVDFNPVPLLLQWALVVPGLQAHNQNVYTIFAELVSNSIEHGLLKLDSSMKSDSAGFRKYYALRAERLQHIDQEWIRVEVEHWARDGGGELVIAVSDSGAGFDFDSVSKEFPKETVYSGRGLPLVRRICSSLEYVPEENKVKACYRWALDEKV